MKPEEIDRLFRDELEKLEAAPDLQWNDETAWEKINTKLQGGWSGLLTGSIIAVVAIGVYMLYSSLFTKETPLPPKQELTQVTVLKIDTIEKVKEKEIIPAKVKKYKLKKIPAKAVDTTVTVVVLPQDTIKKRLMDTNKINQDTNRANEHYRHYLNRCRMLNASVKQTAPVFFMPKYSVLRMDVSNSYNFANLLRSISAEQKAGDNFYYIYEYNKRPAPMDMDRFPVAMPNNRQIITNFSR